MPQVARHGRRISPSYLLLHRLSAVPPASPPPGNHSYHLAVNRFADWTPEEFTAGELVGVGAAGEGRGLGGHGGGGVGPAASLLLWQLGCRLMDCTRGVGKERRPTRWGRSYHGS